MSSKSLATCLADLARLHDEATDAGRKARCRQRAREYAERLKVPVPVWAAMRMRERRPRPKASMRPNYTFRPPQLACTLGPGLPRDIPAELRDWRKRHQGAVVCIGSGGVSLHAIGREVLRFDSVEAAVAAVAQRTARRLDSRVVGFAMRKLGCVTNITR